MNCSVNFYLCVLPVPIHVDYLLLEIVRELFVHLGICLESVVVYPPRVAPILLQQCKVVMSTSQKSKAQNACARRSANPSQDAIGRPFAGLYTPNTLVLKLRSGIV